MTTIRKLAVFVEGETELEFVSRLVSEITTSNRLELVLEKAYGPVGGRSYRNIDTITGNGQIKYHVLIRNSRGESSVLSDMISTASSLESNGYEKVIGIRDVYPQNSTDIPRINSATARAISTLAASISIPLNLHLAVMEIESWFIGEYSHLEKVDRRLTPSFIQSNLGYDIRSIRKEGIHHPAGELNKIRKLVGRAYRKTPRQRHSTINSIDYEELYFNIRGNIPSLDNFIQDFDDFFV